MPDRTKSPATHPPIVELDAPISTFNKGLGAISEALTPSEIAEKQWHLLHEDLSLPTAVLYDERIAHNLQWMQDFIAAYGVKIAPHGKTTMAPKLFVRQLEAGAWGITLATAHQTRVAYSFGVRRIIMANQLMGRQNMATIANLLADASFQFYCLVDSAQQTEQLGTFFRTRKQRINVLIELGVDGGRTGVRNPQQLEALLLSLKAWHKEIAVCGIEIYEGVLDDETSIRNFLQHAVATTQQLAQDNFFDRSPILLSGAGSAWYDVVAEVFSSAHFDYPVEVVLRPGCYLTHDVGVYQAAQQRIDTTNPIAHKMQSSLLPAMQLWAYVQSVPEKGRAIIALGKRDAAFDAGLPTPALHYRPGNATPTACPKAWTLTRMMDQHAYMAIGAEDDIQVGDMIAFDISHPCLTFDKWRYLPVLDDNYAIIDVVQTFF